MVSSTRFYGNIDVVTLTPVLKSNYSQMLSRINFFRKRMGVSSEDLGEDNFQFSSDLSQTQSRNLRAAAKNCTKIVHIRLSIETFFFGFYVPDLRNLKGGGD